MALETAEITLDNELYYFSQALCILPLSLAFVSGLQNVLSANLKISRKT